MTVFWAAPPSATMFAAAPGVLVRENSAESAPTEAVTVKLPAKWSAVNVGATAMPWALAATVAAAPRAPKAPEAPVLPGAATEKVTLAPLTGLPEASVTRTRKGA